MTGRVSIPVLGFRNVEQHRAKGVVPVVPAVDANAKALLLGAKEATIYRPRQEQRVYADMAGDYGAVYNTSLARPDLTAVTLTAVLQSMGVGVHVVDGDSETKSECARLQVQRPVLLRVTLPTWRDDLREASRLASEGYRVIIWGAVVGHLMQGQVEGVGRIFGDAPSAISSEFALSNRSLDVGYAYQSFPIERYIDEYGRRRVHLHASRGCNRTCSYCPYIRVYGRWAPRDLEELARDVDRLVQLGVSVIQFRDQDFPSDGSHSVAVASVLEPFKSRMTWIVEGNLDRFSDALLERLADAGCEEIIIGLESVDPAVLRQSRRRALSGVRERVEAIHGRGLRVRGLFVMGLPGDSWASISHTLDWALELELDSAQFNPYAPLPGESFGISAPAELQDYVPGSNNYMYDTCNRLTQKEVRWAAAASQHVFDNRSRPCERVSIEGKLRARATQEHREGKESL